MVVRRRERRGASRGEVARSFAVAAGEDGGAVLMVVDGDDGANGRRWWRCHGEARCGGSAVSGELTVEGAVVAGEVGGGCVEGGREIRVRVSCVRWRR
ncbi:hypothetical protein DEO72_LG6g1045 [Vigna unguiculata]|uniref:Uncharacterized protein n=1 Tax=Vigna unguiculata TaxID=3917 RepID=A0A4D6M6E5_VIGUN|nr:hypothetical protein DEO72_LG6g1045 [Vigna unguiculata]